MKLFSVPDPGDPENYYVVEPEGGTVELKKIKDKLTEDLRYEVKTAVKYAEWAMLIKEIAVWLTRIELATTQQELEKAAYEINCDDEEYWEAVLKELEEKEE